LLDMDTLTSSFLRDAPYLSSFSDSYDGGILYVEDFDYEPRVEARRVEDEKPAPPVIRLLTQDDLDAARSEGRIEGQQAALADAFLLQSDLRVAALQAIGDSLNVARATLERVAGHHGSECARTIFAMMQAAVPTIMAQHGSQEMQAMLDALLPGLVCEPELRVRAHPELADLVRESLVDRLPADGIVLSVVADPKLSPGDVEVAWQHGQAKRDCKAIFQAIRLALKPLSLPIIEEIRFVHGS
jgi:flagellar biosynthesis/type III secretory pathway protein FliH